MTPYRVIAFATCSMLLDPVLRKSTSTQWADIRKPKMTDQARDDALWGARGVISQWLAGDEADGVSPMGLVASIVRSNEDADPPALRAMVKKAGAINSEVSGSAIGDLYQSACAASTDEPTANPGRSERAACAAIDRWLEERPEDG